MDSQEYWQRRSLEDAARRINLTEDFINDNLKKYYKEAQKEIKQALNEFYKRFADENNITLAEAKRRLKDLDFEKINFEALSEDAGIIAKEIRQLKDKLPDETLKAMESHQAELDKILNAYSKKGEITRLELLDAEIEKTLIKLFNNEQISIYNLLADTYKDGYYRSIYNVQTSFGVGVDFVKPNEAVIQKSVTKSWCKTNYSEKIWGHKKQLAKDLRSHITQGLIQGLGEDEMSKKLAKDLGVSLSNAKRLARTESNYIHNQASLDTYEEYAGIEQYRFLATLDYKTSPICQDLDGKIFSKKEAQVGVNFPPMHPNCRSTITVYFEGDEVGTRAARRSNGKGYEVPADMTYKEWFNNLEETEQGKMKLKLKKERNKTNDKEQFEKYKEILGDEAPKNLAAFQNLKYNKPEKYAELKKLYSQNVKRNKGLAAKIGESAETLHDEPILIKTIDYSNKKTIMEEIKKFETEAVNKKIEMACVITSKGEVYNCFGVKDRVFPDYDLGVENLVNSTISHNHPIEETAYSFSKEDFDLFIDCKLEKLRGCDKLYTYELSLNANEIDKEPEEWATEENYQHCWIIDLAKKYGVGYRRWKNDKS